MTEKFAKWYIADDIEHYQEKGDLIKFPSLDDIKKALQDNLITSFISSSYPPKEFIRYFIIEKLPNKKGLLTSQEAHNKIDESVVLQNQLGISVVKSENSFKDMAGAKPLKEWTKNFLVAEQKGYKSKGIFLVGIPGTGKTFFPQCLAGELERPLIILNLAFLKAKENPIQALNDIFEYLNTTNSKQIILIDEIEKMVGTGEDPLTGRLMTILSDLNSVSSEYKKLDVLVIATANNLDSILKNQPALLRRGRFDELLFVNLPSYDDAKDLFNLYIKKYKVEMIMNLYEIDLLMKDINTIYEDVNTQSRRFIYTPSEIATFISRLAFFKMAEKEITKEVIRKNIKEIVPIAKSAQEGINKIIAQKELFLEI